MLLRGRYDCQNACMPLSPPTLPSLNAPDGACGSRQAPMAGCCAPLTAPPALGFVLLRALTLRRRLARATGTPTHGCKLQAMHTPPCHLPPRPAPSPPIPSPSTPLPARLPVFLPMPPPPSPALPCLITHSHVSNFLVGMVATTAPQGLSRSPLPYLIMNVTPPSPSV